MFDLRSGLQALFPEVFGSRVRRFLRCEWRKRRREIQVSRQDVLGTGKLFLLLCFFRLIQYHDVCLFLPWIRQTVTRRAVLNGEIKLH